MSQFMSGEPKIPNPARGPLAKCRIPLRLPAGRQNPTNSKAKNQKTSKSTKPKSEVVAIQQPRYAMRSSIAQPQSGDTRPRSGNQTKDGSPQVRAFHLQMPSPRLCHSERERPMVQRPSTIPKKVLNETLPPIKRNRPVITVPVNQKQLARSTYTKPTGLPTQEVIKKCEELELQNDELSDTNYVSTDFNEGESITSRSDKIIQMKISWQEKLIQFEKMKNDLTERQTALMEVYAALRGTHQKMTTLGQKATLPPAEDLRIMNVAKLTPEQLLQLCAGADHKSDDKTKSPVTIDINKLYNMPSKLINSCEHTLDKRKEIIDWFEKLKTQEKGISTSTLSKKINEFNAENEMMKSSLELVKADFFKELNEIIEFVRKSVTETIALQLQMEELNYTLSDLNSQNDDLRKQINHSNHLRSHTTKGRIEELEKELKEERCKKIVMKDRLTKAEGQMKIGKERASQLEATLEQARSQTWTLERTVQQLRDQNKKLQDDFDREFSKLTESIKENTAHLEEIADAREKLQSEKEDLEKRLSELSEYYNESINNIKHEMNVNVAKLIETEKKCDEEIVEKKRLESQVESLCAQLVESQLRVKEITKQLEEKDLQLKSAKDTQKELETTKAQLEDAKVIIEEYEKRLTKQSEAIKEIERNLKETINLEETLKNNLSNKDEYIIELEKKQSLLEQQLQESECKMESYEEQLSSLKNHISQLQEDFGEFGSLNDLHEMVNQQRAKLLEMTRQNGELAEALQKKDLELEQHIENCAEQESLLEQREGIIKTLSEKEAEHLNIIKLLRNNLEIRAQADADLNQQIREKNVEIDTLITNVETRKQTISQLEKIILTLEDQTRKASQQRRKDQEKIRSLEEKLIEYETINMEFKRSFETPSRNLDHFIKILEDELGTCINTHYTTENEYMVPKQSYVGDHKRSNSQKFEYDLETNKEYQYKSRDYDNVPTKVTMGKTSKNMHVLPSHENQFTGDNLGRKRGITNIDTQNMNTAPEPVVNVYTTAPPVLDTLALLKERVPGGPQKDNYPVRNLPFLIPHQLRDDKKIKMFKFAGHRL